MTLVKAVLINLDAKDGDESQKFECLFNPSEYSIVISNNWKDKPSQTLRVPKMVFTGGKSGTLDLTLFFDVYEIPNASVLQYTDKLLKLTEIEESTRHPITKQGRPPKCCLQWGSMKSFNAVVTKVGLKFTLFREDGTPVRATAAVSLVEAQEIPSQPPPPNPDQVRKVYTIKDGDTLSSIAADQYNDATEWRLIALANDLKDEDIVKLKVGKELKIPDLV